MTSASNVPFSMAAIAWLLFRFVFVAWIPVADADQYIAGCIILAAGDGVRLELPVGGDPAYTLVQVSVNDLVMLVLFAPIVRFLWSGAPDEALIRRACGRVINSRRCPADRVLARRSMPHVCYDYTSDLPTRSAICGRNEPSAARSSSHPA